MCPHLYRKTWEIRYALVNVAAPTTCYFALPTNADAKTRGKKKITEAKDKETKPEQRHNHTALHKNVQKRQPPVPSRARACVIFHARTLIHARKTTVKQKQTKDSQRKEERKTDSGQLQKSPKFLRRASSCIDPSSFLASFPAAAHTHSLTVTGSFFCRDEPFSTRVSLLELVTS